MIIEQGIAHGVAEIEYLVQRGRDEGDIDALEDIAVADTAEPVAHRAYLGDETGGVERAEQAELVEIGVIDPLDIAALEGVAIGLLDGELIGIAVRLVETAQSGRQPGVESVDVDGDGQIQIQVLDVRIDWHGIRIDRHGGDAVIERVGAGLGIQMHVTADRGGEETDPDVARDAAGAERAVGLGLHGQVGQVEEEIRGTAVVVEAQAQTQAGRQSGIDLHLRVGTEGQADIVGALAEFDTEIATTTGNELEIEHQLRKTIDDVQICCGVTGDIDGKRPQLLDDILETADGLRCREAQ